MKTSLRIILLVILIFPCYFLFGQNNGQNFKMGKVAESVSLPINEFYNETKEIFPFGESSTKIYGLTISADITFKSDKSIVRFILLDKNFKEYLVYETYPLLESGSSVTIDELCEETCVLNGVHAKALRIEITDTEVNFNSITYSTKMEPGTNIEKIKHQKKIEQNADKINRINQNLAKNGAHWVAGITDVSEMTYEERKELYGQSTFPAGFEYYAGGIVSTSSGSQLKSASASSDYVEYWDWRNRHGKNFISPIKNQGACGSCWAFASTGATEAMVNLYFNQQLNLDLSEQDVLSCSGGGDCGGGYPSTALNYITNTGIVDEASFPYAAADLNCNEKANNPNELIKIGGKIDLGTTAYPKTEDGLKKMLIEMGPVSGGLYDWSHAMVLVGYKVVKEGDIFYHRNLDLRLNWITIEAGDPLIGKTVWIFKNSWGKYFGDEGYVYVETPISNFGWTHGLKTPVISNIHNYNVICEDNDGDGYYWWGFGPKPATCNGPDQPDGDDSDPTLGPLDQYGFCIKLNNPPVANFTSNNTTVTEGESITFSDLSSTNTTSWSWTFEGGNPSSSTQKNPTVVYNTPGVYSVTLTVANSFGSSTKTMTNYVTVEEIIPEYCSSHGNTSEEWIATVQFANLQISSSYSTGGYKDYSEYVTFNTNGGSTQNFVLKPKFVSTAKGEFWRIWIDYNGDMDFDDNGELVYSSPSSTGDISGSFIIPANLNITTRMRVSMKRDATPSACEAFSYGEVEDYSIKIISPTNQAPVANFAANNTTITEAETISFTDLSTYNPTSWSWSFQGGTPSTSNIQNPSVTYNTPGIYNVTLTVSNSSGSDTKTVSGFITVKDGSPIANFTANNSTITEGETILYTDLSTNNPESCSWVFEGGTPATSTQQNPVIIYNNPGIYAVSLTVSNSFGTDTKVVNGYITVKDGSPIANFSANSSIITEGEEITFTDLSSNNPQSWSWVFEGGTPQTSQQQNPVVIYNTYGVYSVSLTISNSFGTDTKVISGYITVEEALPIADFASNNSAITQGESVSFTDLSFNNPASWSWVFEGGTPATSIQQNPVVVYNTPGIYGVSLTVGNTAGTDTKVVNGYVTVTDGSPVADFTTSSTTIINGESVSFTDLSSNNPQSWSWVFEGGTPETSQQQNPVVTYETPGVYSVSLTTVNSLGTDTKVINGYITVEDGTPVANFTANNRTIMQGETVSFIDISSNTPETWSWIFEGALPASSSTVQNPNVTYNTPGIYSVSLTVSNSHGTDTKTVGAYITVKDGTPVADFKANSTVITEGETVSFTDLSTNNPGSWLWSFDGGTPATSNLKNPVITYNTPGVYKVSLTVSNSFGTDSKVVDGLITVQEYIPEYCKASGDASAEWIETVEIGGNINTSGGQGYEDFTSIVFNLEAGQTYSLSLVPGSISRTKFQYWSVWIDFNADMDFSDDGEQIFTASKEQSMVSGLIKIPENLNIDTRIRIAMHRGSLPSECGTFDFGEVEDYSVHIENIQRTPIAQFEATQTSIQPNGSIQFNDVSSNEPTTWQWSFPGGTPASSNEKNPIVMYQNSGEYDVTLVVSKPGFPTSEEKKLKYISVDSDITTDYCSPIAVNSSSDYIKYFSIKNVVNETSAGNGYSVSENNLTLIPGQSYNLNMSPFNSKNRNFWKVWIDFNQDGDFDDSDETIVTENNKRGDVITSMLIPDYAAGNTRLRVVMKNDKSPSACDDNFSGEVQDYFVNFEAPAARLASSMPGEEPGAEIIRNCKFYPNPVVDKLKITLDLVESGDFYSIYNIQGRLLDSKQINSATMEIDLDTYTPGIYLVTVLNKGTLFREKIIKK